MKKKFNKLTDVELEQIRIIKLDIEEGTKLNQFDIELLDKYIDYLEYKVNTFQESLMIVRSKYNSDKSRYRRKAKNYRYKLREIYHEIDIAEDDLLPASSPLLSKIKDIIKRD